MPAHVVAMMTITDLVAYREEGGANAEDPNADPKL